VAPLPRSTVADGTAANEKAGRSLPRPARPLPPRETRATRGWLPSCYNLLPRLPAVSITPHALLANLSLTCHWIQQPAANTSMNALAQGR
jgi:hypothetical protein